jgi:hypothetical protein
VTADHIYGGEYRLRALLEERELRYVVGMAPIGSLAAFKRGRDLRN